MIDVIMVLLLKRSANRLPGACVRLDDCGGGLDMPLRSISFDHDPRIARGAYNTGELNLVNLGGKTQ